MPIIENLTTTSSGATGPRVPAVCPVTACWRTRLRSGPVAAGLVDRGGRELARLGSPGDIGDIAASPDGSAIAVSLIDTARSTRDLWLYPTAGGPGRRITFEAADEFARSGRPTGPGCFQLATRRARSALRHRPEGHGRASGARHRSRGHGPLRRGLVPGQSAVLYIAGGRAIHGVTSLSRRWPDHARPARCSIRPSSKHTGRIAPGGDWFASTFNETGQLEVYIDRFPSSVTSRVISSAAAAALVARRAANCSMSPTPAMSCLPRFAPLGPFRNRHPAQRCMRSVAPARPARCLRLRPAAGRPFHRESAARPTGDVDDHDHPELDRDTVGAVTGPAASSPFGVFLFGIDRGDQGHQQSDGNASISEKA